MQDSEVKIKDSEVKIQAERKVDDSEVEVQGSEVKFEDSEVKIDVINFEAKGNDSEVKLQDSEVEVEDSVVIIEDSEVKMEVSEVSSSMAYYIQYIVGHGSSNIEVTSQELILYEVIEETSVGSSEIALIASSEGGKRLINLGASHLHLKFVPKLLHLRHLKISLADVSCLPSEVIRSEVCSLRSVLCQLVMNLTQMILGG